MDWNGRGQCAAFYCCATGMANHENGSLLNLNTSCRRMTDLLLLGAIERTIWSLLVVVVFSGESLVTSDTFQHD